MQTSKVVQKNQILVLHWAAQVLGIGFVLMLVSIVKRQTRAVRQLLWPVAKKSFVAKLIFNIKSYK